MADLRQRDVRVDRGVDRSVSQGSKLESSCPTLKDAPNLQLDDRTMLASAWTASSVCAAHPRRLSSFFLSFFPSHRHSKHHVLNTWVPCPHVASFSIDASSVPYLGHILAFHSSILLSAQPGCLGDWPESNQAPLSLPFRGWQC